MASWWTCLGMTVMIFAGTHTYHLASLFSIAGPKWQCYWIVKLPFLCSRACHCGGRIQSYLNSSYLCFSFQSADSVSHPLFTVLVSEELAGPSPLLHHIRQESQPRQRHFQSHAEVWLSLIQENSSERSYGPCISCFVCLNSLVSLFKMRPLVMTTSKFYYEYWMRSFMESEEWEQ